MPVFTQGVFDSMLGYSLKRDYLGNTLNWRNVETFDFEVQITDLTNINTKNGLNYLSTYIINQISTKLNTDKKNITIKSINIQNSHGGLEDLIRGAKYNVTAEVRTAIDQATLLAQHPELDDTNPAGGQDGEDNKFRGVRNIFVNYAKEIDSISESFSFDDKEDGSYSFSHNIDLGLRSRRDPTTGAFTHNSKTLAGWIAAALFAEDSNNEYFGHNTFTSALKDFGNSANNKHYFDETYDAWKGRYSFVKKMTVLPTRSLNKNETRTTDEYTQNKKYSIDFNTEGKVTVTETTEIKSRDKNWNSIKDSVPNVIDKAYSHCSAKLQNYNATIDGQGANSVAAVLYNSPLQKSVTYDKQGLKATVTMQFSSDVTGYGNAQTLETVDLSRDHRGVVTATYNLTLTSHREKTFNADTDQWILPSCTVPGLCSDTQFTTEATCRGAGTCWDGANVAQPAFDNNEVGCENADPDNYFVSANENWTPYNTRTLCEGAGGNFTDGQNPVETLRAWEQHPTSNIVSFLCTYVNYANLANTAKGVFWNTLSWWWPTGSDHIPHAVPGGGNTYNTNMCFFYPVTTSVSAPNMGKAFTLTKTFTNDVNRSRQSSWYPAGFKKMEVKWNDTWPQETINEHPIINRGTSWLTFNQPRTSVLANAFNTQPGKRSVTINAVLPRPSTNNLTNPDMPQSALFALAYEARQTLFQVFLDDHLLNMFQMTAHISSVSYTYDSENNISLTAELSYTVKAAPSTPGIWTHPLLFLPPSKPFPPLLPPPLF